MTEHPLAPAARAATALDLVQRYANWSLASGVLPMPLLDATVLTGLQLRMLQALSAHYDIPFSHNLGKAVLSSLLGGLIPGSLSFGTAGTVLRLVPVIGQLLGVLILPAFAWASTYAVGKIFIQHFESGGTFLSIEPAVMQAQVQREFAAQYAVRTGSTGPCKPGA